MREHSVPEWSLNGASLRILENGNYVFENLAAAADVIYAGGRTLEDQTPTTVSDSRLSVMFETVAAGCIGDCYYYSIDEKSALTGTSGVSYTDLALSTKNDNYIKVGKTNGRVEISKWEVWSEPLSPPIPAIIPTNSQVQVESLMTKAELDQAQSSAGFDASSLWPVLLERLGMSGACRFPVGKFLFPETLHFHKRMMITGTSYIRGGGGFPQGDGLVTVFKFPTDTDGIVIHAYNTHEDVVGPVPGANVLTTPRGDGTWLEHLWISGSPYSTVKGHGLSMRGACACTNVSIGSFGAGNGFNIVAGVTANDDGYGNANLFQLWGCSAISNGGHGFYANLSDSNAGFTIGFNAVSNGGHGMYDSSFLGNTHTAAHTANNGSFLNHPNNSSSRVHDNGRRYHCSGIGDPSTTQPMPGMDFDKGDPWDDVGTGPIHFSTYPQWESGKPYHYAAGYFSDGSTARNLWLGCYAEGDQASMRTGASDIVLGGLQAGRGGPLVRGGWGQDGRYVTGGHIHRSGSPSRDFYINPGDDRYFKVSAEGDHPNGLAFKYEDKLHHNYVFQHAELDSRVGMGFVCDNNTLRFGRASANDITSGVPYLPMGVFVGSGINGRAINYVSDKPTDGAGVIGDIRFSNKPVAGGSVGWVCISDGAGSVKWNSFGLIEA